MPLQSVCLRAEDQREWDAKSIPSLYPATEEHFWTGYVMRQMSYFRSIYGVGAREAIQKQIEEGNYRIRDIAAIVNKTGYFDTEDPGNYINQNTPPH